MFRKILPHVAIIISCMYFVFFFIDRVNPMMNFIDNDMTKFLLVALGVVAILNAIVICATTADARAAARGGGRTGVESSAPPRGVFQRAARRGV